MREKTTMKMPALAVVGPDHRIIRSTDSFRRRYEDAEALCEQSPEIDLVLTGRADVATVNLGTLNVEIEAVTDAAGRRQAMLTLPPDGPSPEPEPPMNALRDGADESPAIVWVKDLDGRYLYANPRYTEDLDTSEERLRGNTDADLPETETVDGPRLRYVEDGLEEPLQLEYTIPAVDGHPAFVAFRFALRDASGRPIATCGVAAPLNEAQVARDEAVRLMQLERWNRLDPVEVRAELLEQWHVRSAPPRATDPEAEAIVARDEDEAPVGHDEDELDSPHAAPADVEPPHDQHREEVSAPHEERSRTAEETSRPPEAPAAPAPPPPPPASAPSLAAPSLSDPAEVLQTDLQLARKWADRADQLQGELQEAMACVRQAESDAQQALAAAARAGDEAARARAELEHTRVELERSQDDAQAARFEAKAARSELAGARARTEELDRALARARACLTDFDSALAHDQAARQRSF